DAYRRMRRFVDAAAFPADVLGPGAHRSSAFRHNYFCFSLKPRRGPAVPNRSINRIADSASGRLAIPNRRHMTNTLRMITRRARGFLPLAAFLLLGSAIPAAAKKKPDFEFTNVV